MHAMRLQSGFLAWPSPELVQQDEHSGSFRDAVLSPEFKMHDTENYYDRGVESLFSQWRKDDSLIHQFNFREAILLTAMRCFRDKSIVPWLRLQVSQTRLGYLHRNFLTGMFDSAVRNIPKSLDNFQYYRLLTPKDTERTVSKQERDITGILDELLQPGEDSTVSNILANWTVDIDGFIDLLVCLHVIFGKREGIHSVSQRTA